MERLERGRGPQRGSQALKEDNNGKERNPYLRGPKASYIQAMANRGSSAKFSYEEVSQAVKTAVCTFAFPMGVTRPQPHHGWG